MEAKVFYKNKSVECHEVPTRVGITTAQFSTSDNSETSMNDNDMLGGTCERFYIDGQGAHLERGRLSNIREDWEHVWIEGSTPGRNVIATAEAMRSGDVVRITLDDEQVWPAVENAEDRVANVIDDIQEKLDSLVI